MIVHDDNLPKQRWNLGRVIKLIPGNDGHVRGARVKLGKSKHVISRPINRLYPIELQQNENIDSENKIDKDISEENNCNGDIVKDIDTKIGGRVHDEVPVETNDKNRCVKRNAAILGTIRRRYLNC